MGWVGLEIINCKIMMYDRLCDIASQRATSEQQNFPMLCEITKVEHLTVGCLSSALLKKRPIILGWVVMYASKQG